MQNGRMAFLAIALILSACAAQNVERSVRPAHAEFAGVYAAGPLAVTEIEAIDDHIAVVPPFWGSRPYLTEAAPDVFAFALPSPRPDRTITFSRDALGAVAEFSFTNVDRNYDGQVFRRLNRGETTPAQMFMARRPVDAANAALSDPNLSLAHIRAFATSHLSRHPTRTADTIAFLESIRRRHPDDADLEAIYASALIANHQREQARLVLERALTLNPEQPLARENLRRLDLHQPEAGSGYRAVLPFSLADAFAAPTSSEIADVRADWARRDLAAHDVEIVHRFTWTLSHASYDGVIVRHSVLGAAHYGAILTPSTATGPLPVLIDARGVNPTYSPRDITGGVDIAQALGAHQSEFVIVIPAMIGNTLIVDGREFTSGGDPSDAWDGATNTTLALLNVALEIAPRADPRRVAIFGHSRGGAVALLAAVRDRRITLVLSASGPVDQFEAMQPVVGWRWAELLADDMSDGVAATLEEESGQKFDHFFDRSETLSAVRHRMIASSALYFAEALPETHAYYGAEDTSVPLANATALRDRFAQLGRLNRDAFVRVFEGRGHDTDPLLMRRSAIAALLAWAER
jgi:pimeloyl-ACP methyl ester carboxylesterase